LATPRDTIATLGPLELETLQALLTHHRRKDAAAALGITKQSLSLRLSEHPAVLEAYLEDQRDAVRELAAAAWDDIPEARKKMREIMSDTDTPPQIALSAAKMLADVGFKLRESSDTAERLERLELALKDRGDR
jgi:hypothetical protein